MTRRYFDWAATSPPDSNIHSEALRQALETPGNPSSPHADGRAAREALEHARARCAAALGVETDNIYFTSGGTESNNLILQSLILKRGDRGIITSAVEHPAVAQPVERLKKLGVPTAVVRPLPDGRIAPEALARSVERLSGCSMTAVMAVNNETGAVNDVAALVAAARAARGSKGLHFHCDAVQALGKTYIDLKTWDVDSASFSAHKIGGPRGVGILYLRKSIEPLYSGGEQERGVRAGTENLFGALAFALALEKYAVREAVAENQARAATRWARFIGALKSIEGCALLPQDRIERDERFSPFILQAAFKGVPGEVLVRVLDDAGFSISTGSACSSRSHKRPILEAMGVDEQTAFEAVRFSHGFGTTDEDLQALISGLQSCLRSLR